MGFEFTERKVQGQMVRAGDRDHYYPVYYIEPIEGNRAALAFDLASDPVRRAALYECRDSGQPQATARITLVQETGHEWAALFFVPAYYDTPTDVSERRASLQGVISGVLRIHDFLIAAGVQVPDGGDIEIQILDRSAPAGEQLLHQTEDITSSLAYNYRQERNIHGAGGRRWEFIATPTKAYVAKNHTESPFVSFLIGFTLTGLLSQYLARLAHEKRRVDGEVTKRTQELRTQSADLSKTNADLEREIAERRQLQQRITEVTDHEQRRLGQELHDSLGQQIAVTSMLAQSIRQRLEATAPDQLSVLDRLSDSAQNAQAQVRALSKGLIPVEIGPGGLQNALAQLAASTRGVSDADIIFDGDETITVQDNQEATHLYRIAQEALRNALEHGETTQVCLSIQNADGSITLRVADNGSGFSGEEKVGAGLSSMRHRADSMGAMFSIESDHDRGTIVTCALPVT